MNIDRSFRGRILSGVASAALALGSLAFGAGQAHATQLGFVSDYPVGLTMGIPVGAAPPPGVYFVDFGRYSQGNTTTNSGKNAGGRATVVANTGEFIWSPGISVLGASYYGFIAALGFVDAQVQLPRAAGGGTYMKSGAPDTVFSPIDLSWNLGGGKFLGAGFIFIPPVGTYSQTDVVNIGQNVWDLSPNIAFSYLGHGYDLTANMVFDIYSKNPETQFTNGADVNVDLTATKKFGKWEVGPVGYFYRQFEADSGPAALSTGMPTEAAAGLLVGYDFGPITFSASYTHDFLAYDVPSQGLWRTLLSLRF